MYQRKEIDAAFAKIAEDADYQKEAALLAEEFEHSDWEALKLEEEDLRGEPSYDEVLCGDGPTAHSSQWQGLSEPPAVSRRGFSPRQSTSAMRGTGDPDLSFLGIQGTWGYCTSRDQ
jgi:hypothetical protein